MQYPLAGGFRQLTPAAPMTSPMMRTPSSALDPYADQALLDPWPLYRELREMGPVGVVRITWLENEASSLTVGHSYQYFHRE